jgi:hypothetical protein
VLSKLEKKAAERIKTQEKCMLVEIDLELVTRFWVDKRKILVIC